MIAPAERAVELFHRVSQDRDERRGDVDPGLRDQVVRNWIDAQAYRWYTFSTCDHCASTACEEPTRLL